MKNQYYADVNDYRKYGLLRGLVGLAFPVDEDLDRDGLAVDNGLLPAVVTLAGHGDGLLLAWVLASLGKLAGLDNGKGLTIDRDKTWR